LLNNRKIKQVKSHGLLGLQIDEDLTFDCYVEELNRKLSKRIGVLKHISPYLKQTQRELFYKTIIKPTILYCATIWAYGNKDHETNIIKLQKRAARSILKADRHTRSINMFNSLNWLPFTAETYINRCTLAFKRTRGKTPSYINNALKLNSENHTRNTRYSKLNLLCPRTKRKTEGGRTVAVKTITEWNKLSKEIKESESCKHFKKTLFNKLIEEQKTNLQFFHS